MELVTVIIPTYGCRGKLRDSVDSVLSQSYNSIEIIVVDDNPPESEARRKTEEILKEYEQNPSVTYLKHPENRNGAAARNTGIRASIGDYIAFLDDDDIFLDGKLSKQTKFLEEHPECDAVYCFARREKYGCPQNVIEGNGTREILMLESNFYTPTLMFRREALEKINGFDESFRRHQDYELLLRFFSAGFKIGCVPEVLVEIGLNQGENTPVGKKLDDLKDYFFSKFNSFIMNEDKITPGFAKKVYATHFAGVFLSHIKTKEFRRAIKTIKKYFPYSPKQFTAVIWGSIKAHLS